MTKQQTAAGVGGFLGILILILDGKTALIGASKGLELCIRTLIPSLFPFFVFSILMTSSLVGSSIGLLKPVGRLFHIPRGAESLLIASFLGGYPVGAQCVAAAHRRGQLNTDTAQRMLAFCSNAGPSFLFGIVGVFFPQRQAPWVLWAIHIISAWMVAQLIPSCQETVGTPCGSSVSLSDAMTAAVKTMGSVCGWVVLFRVILEFLDRWALWLLTPAFQVAITGLLELANGCCCLPYISSLPVRFMVCSGMLALGGICVALQTSSVTGDLSLKFYFIGKGLQCIFSLLLCCGILFEAWWIPLLLLPGTLVISAKTKNRSRNPENAVV